MSLQRRAMVGVGLAAVAAGAGVAWWRYAPSAPQAGAEQAFWALALKDPQGAPIDMAAFKGRPVLVNFWATWCPPCVEEMPMLDSFYQAQRAAGWQVLGIAVDQPDAVRSFLKRMPMAYPVAMAGFDGVALSRELGNTGGALPFTVVFDAAGRLSHSKVGKVHPDDLNAWAKLP